MKYFSYLIMALMASLISCGGSRSTFSSSDGEPMEMKYSDLLKINRNNGFMEVTVKNPWDTVRILHRYILVPKDSILPDILPEGTVIRTPVSNALVYSTVHTSLLGELGATEAIGGMCDVGFVNDPLLARRIREGEIVDCGLPDNPVMERVIALKPDLIMLSPYENNDQYSKVSSLGIPVLECADYMETSPLGRAEWIRLYGLLFGVAEKGENLFGDIERQYLDLRATAAKAEEKPRVLTDQRYGQVWNVPCGNSTMGKLIEDAGGINPFGDYRTNGSVALSPEKVLSVAHDADIWLLRYNQRGEKTLAELGADSPVNAQFDAFRRGEVYGCNTADKNLFEDTPFHPERFLRDMVMIFHPGLLGNGETAYFHKLK